MCFSPFRPSKPAASWRRWLIMELLPLLSVCFPCYFCCTSVGGIVSEAQLVFPRRHTWALSWREDEVSDYRGHRLVGPAGHCWVTNIYLSGGNVTRGPFLDRMEQRALFVSDSGTQQVSWQQHEVAGKLIYAVNDKMTSVLVLSFFFEFALMWYFFKSLNLNILDQSVIYVIPLNLNLNCDFFPCSCSLQNPVCDVVVTPFLGLNFNLISIFHVYNTVRLSVFSNLHMWLWQSVAAHRLLGK